MGSSYDLLMYNLSNCEFLNNIDKYENNAFKNILLYKYNFCRIILNTSYKT